MGIINRVHHVGFMTKTFDSLCKYLIKGFGFKLIFSKNNENILQSGRAIFSVKNFTDHNFKYQVDTVFDVALEVSNINEVIVRAEKNNVRVISYPNRIRDELGFVDVAQLSSCVGNVVHTIIDKSFYSGTFLPGYNKIETDKESNEEFVRSFDHITYVVGKNCSNSVINWYSDLFDMKRFFINKYDLLNEGFVLHHKDNGMRLTAFDYWKCNENFLANDSESCKFVVAEELTNTGENQITAFLKEHLGPGVQHIGLSVNNIIDATEMCTSNGAEFIFPPTGYYDIIRRNPKIHKLELYMSKFEKYGILIDAETDFCCLNDDSEKESFLYQVFTKPIFDRNTFFLELVQRQGATGFGTGNIKALWDALGLSLKSKQESAGIS